MRASERESLRRRYQFRCAYCGVRESDVGAELTVDHFQPTSRGGADESENWVYSCHACNEFKSDSWDPESVCRILHPERDDIATHIDEVPDGTLRPLTECGAFHIEWLHLNRQQLVAYRRERRMLEAARQVEARLLHLLEDLDSQIKVVMEELATLRSRDSTL
jgi:HNH endonuclease